MKKEYKDPLLKITPSNTTAYHTKSVESGLCPLYIQTMVKHIEQILEESYCTQPNAKYFSGNIYRIGDCMVHNNRYSWFLGYTYSANNNKPIPLWCGVDY